MTPPLSYHTRHMDAAAHRLARTLLERGPARVNGLGTEARAAAEVLLSAGLAITIAPGVVELAPAVLGALEPTERTRAEMARAKADPLHPWHDADADPLPFA